MKFNKVHLIVKKKDWSLGCSPLKYTPVGFYFFIQYTSDVLSLFNIYNIVSFNFGLSFWNKWLQIPMTRTIYQAKQVDTFFFLFGTIKLNRMVSDDGQWQRLMAVAVRPAFTAPVEQRRPNLAQPPLRGRFSTWLTVTWRRSPSHVLGSSLGFRGMSLAERLSL